MKLQQTIAMQRKNDGRSKPLKTLHRSCGRPLAPREKRHYTFGRCRQTPPPGSASPRAQGFDVAVFFVITSRMAALAILSNSLTVTLCSLRLSVRTPPFHGGESGSIPLGSTTPCNGAEACCFPEVALFDIGSMRSAFRFCGARAATDASATVLQKTSPTSSSSRSACLAA